MEMLGHFGASRGRVIHVEPALHHVGHRNTSSRLCTAKDAFWEDRPADEHVRAFAGLCRPQTKALELIGRHAFEIQVRRNSFYKRKAQAIARGEEAKTGTFSRLLLVGAQHLIELLGSVAPRQYPARAKLGALQVEVRGAPSLK
jgi:hypothetical protein